MLPLLSLSNCAKSIFATAFPPDIGAAGVRVRYAYEGEFDGEDDDDDHERGRRPRVSTTTSTTTKSMECPTTTTSAPGQATAMMCHVFFVIPTDVYMYKKASSQKAFVSTGDQLTPPLRLRIFGSETEILASVLRSPDSWLSGERRNILPHLRSRSTQTELKFSFSDLRLCFMPGEPELPGWNITVPPKLDARRVGHPENARSGCWFFT